MTLNGEPYCKLVQVPTPKQLISLKPQEVQALSKLDVKKGSEIVVDRSSFIPYVVKVNSIEKINDVYKKLKLVQPSARHIVCAYSVPHDKSYFANDYQDDGEPGAGRIMSELLINNKIDNVAVFVARKYGGIRMGGDRFLCYEKAAKQVLEALIQLITRADQQEIKQQQWQASKTTIQRQSESYRKPSNHTTQRGSNNYRSNRRRNYTQDNKPSYAHTARQQPNPPTQGFYMKSMQQHKGHTFDYRSGRVIQPYQRGRGSNRYQRRRNPRYNSMGSLQHSQENSITHSETEMEYEFSEPDQMAVGETWFSDQDSAWADSDTQTKDID